MYSEVHTFLDSDSFKKKSGKLQEQNGDFIRKKVIGEKKI